MKHSKKSLKIEILPSLIYAMPLGISLRSLYSNRNKQIYIIRDHLYLQIPKIVFFCNFVEKFFETFFQRAKQEGFMIFWYVNQILFQIVDPMIGSILYSPRIFYRKFLYLHAVESPFTNTIRSRVLRAFNRQVN
jgi:hypothetical protein